MKIKKSDLASLQSLIAAKVAAKVEKGQRQTTPAPDVRVVKNENVSISKYLRGLWLGAWDNAPEEQRIYKALNTAIGTQGGFLVPEEISTDLIELVKAKAVVRRMPGVKVIPMKRDTWSQRRIDTGPVVTWGTQNTSITEDTALAFGKVELRLKDCRCLYKTSRQLIHDADVSVDAMVKSEMADAIALGEDAAFMHGRGGDEPLGLYNDPRILWTRLDATLTFDDLMEAEYQLEKNKRMLTGWIMNPREKLTLRKLKDGEGRYLYVPGKFVADGKSTMDSLNGVPVAYTTQIPITAKSGTNESYLLAGQWDDLLIGDSTEGLRMEATQEGGDAFQYDQVWFKVVKRVDITTRHPESFIRVIDART